MRIVVLIGLSLLLQPITCDNSIKTQWQNWKVKYNKKYSKDEDHKRLAIWRNNLKLVNEHNKRQENGQSTFRMGMNSLAATSAAEFKRMLMPPRFAILPPNVTLNTILFGNTESLPQSVDWRNDGYVTPVKNQGQLGSCYSFSAVQAVEGQFSKQTGKLLSFSEQQIVDCNQGGDGGFPFKVYPYLIQCGGSETETDYPYTAEVSSSCQYDPNKAVATLSTSKFVLPLSDETALESAVANVGPISVSAIKVFASFQLYKSGVYYEPLCNDPNLNGEGYHAMLATGYGATSDGEAYWTVKNSWGTGWGEEGYILMARNKNDNCGIASQATYPVMTTTQTKMSNAGENVDGDGGSGFVIVPSAIITISACCIAFIFL